MSEFQINRAPSRLAFTVERSQAEDRDLLHNLPALSQFESIYFRRKNSEDKVLLPQELPRGVGSQLGSLQVALHAALSNNDDLALPLALWAEDRGLLNIKLRDSQYHRCETNIDRLCYLLGSNKSGWFRDLHRAHLNEHTQAVAAKEKLSAEWKGSFLKKTAPLIQGGLLPISEDAARQRVVETQIEICNYFHSPIDCPSFDAKSRCLTIASLDLDWLEESDLMHELFHAISGRSVLRFSKQDNQSYFVQRVGLSIDSPYGNPDYSSHFNWLNEGVTEYLTRLISPQAEINALGQKYSEAYDLNVALVTSLIEDWGIPRELILNAYFEDDQTGSGGSSYPAWAPLSSAFNQAFGKAALRKLDQFIHHEGIEEALNLLHILKTSKLIFN